MATRKQKEKALERAAISTALEYAFSDQSAYIEDGDPIGDYGAEWPETREKKAKDYRDMAALAGAIGEPGRALQFEQLALTVEEMTDEDEQCSGGCGRVASECATHYDASFCADADDFRLYGCPETFEQFEAKREAAE